VRSSADLETLGARIQAYAGASQVRWVVAAKTVAEAGDLIARLGQELGASGRATLAHVELRALGAGIGGDQARAWLEPQIGQQKSDASCAWQVWIFDQDAPTEAAGPAALPAAPGDRFPVGRSATFRVGFTGLIQSQVYAFGETKPGVVRDLAKAGDVNIAVSPDGASETLLLVKARQAVPMFEAVKARLDEAARNNPPGQRVALGPSLALEDGLLGKRRGIGSNVQVVKPGMIVRNMAASKPAAGAEASTSPASDDFVETCMLTLVGTAGRP
jgi:hypothetical protein